MALPDAQIASLTPSEVVLLNGERFTGYSKTLEKLNSSKLNLPASEEKALASDLGFAILATAILAAEKTNTIRLEIGEKKTMLGLRKVRTIFVTPGPDAPAWPEGSLEARTRELALAALDGARPLEVDGLAAGLIAEDSTNAWHEAVDRVQKALHARGLLTIEEERQLKIFKVERYRATPGAIALARDAATLQHAQDLLADAQATRPDVWELLGKEIREAIAKRTERDDDDLNFD